MAAGDELGASKSVKNVDNSRVFKCCKTRPVTKLEGNLVCIKCSAVWHQSCAGRLKFKILGETSVNCCESEQLLSTLAEGDDSKNTGAKPKAPEDRASRLERENELLQRLYEQVEEKNGILKVQNLLLLEKIAYLEEKIGNMPAKKNGSYNNKQHSQPSFTFLTGENDSNQKLAESLEYSISGPKFHRERSSGEAGSILTSNERVEEMLGKNRIHGGQKQRRDKSATASSTMSNVAIHAIQNPPRARNGRNSVSAVDVNKDSGRGNMNIGDNDGFTTVKYRRREKHRQVAIIGTEKSSSEGDTLCGVAKRLWLYVGRTGKDTTEGKVLNYLRNKHQTNDFTCEKLVTKSEYPSFRVSASLKLKESLEDHAQWPEGVVVRRFTFNRSQTRKTFEGGSFLEEGKKIIAAHA